MVTTSLSFSLKRIVVFPAASKPTIRILTGSAVKSVLQARDRNIPIFLGGVSKGNNTIRQRQWLRWGWRNQIWFTLWQQLNPYYAHSLIGRWWMGGFLNRSVIVVDCYGKGEWALSGSFTSPFYTERCRISADDYWLIIIEWNWWYCCSWRTCYLHVVLPLWHGDRVGTFKSPSLSFVTDSQWIRGDVVWPCNGNIFPAFVQVQDDNFYTVGSFISLRSRDSISNAIRHRRDRLSEWAQCDSNMISCAVALFSAFFFPFLHDMPERAGPILRCHVFSLIFASLLLLTFFNQFLACFWSDFFLFFQPMTSLWFIEWLLRPTSRLKKLEISTHRCGESHSSR